MEGITSVSTRSIKEIAAGKKVMDMTTKYHAIYFKEFGVAVLQ